MPDDDTLLIAKAALELAELIRKTPRSNADFLRGKAKEYQDAVNKEPPGEQAMAWAADARRFLAIAEYLDEQAKA